MGTENFFFCPQVKFGGGGGGEILNFLSLYGSYVEAGLSILDIDLDINKDKMKYTTFMSCHQIMGQSHNIRIAKESLESVAGFKFLM
jgi:hypothetical protein